MEAAPWGERGHAGFKTAIAGVYGVMLVELLTCQECAPCDKAIAVWREACAARDLEFEVLDAGDPRGKQRIEALELAVLPAILFDGRLVAVGLQTPADAQHLLAVATLADD